MTNKTVLQQIKQKTGKQTLNTNIYKHENQYYLIIKETDGTNTIYGGYDDRYTAQKKLKNRKTYTQDKNYYNLPANITKDKQGKYKISRTHFGETFYAGSYNTLEEAEYIRKELDKNNWNKKELPFLQYETPTYEFKFIRKLPNGTFYVIRNNVIFGVFDDLESAKRFREQLTLHGWDCDMQDIRKVNNEYEVHVGREKFGGFESLVDARSFRDKQLR